VAPYLFITDEKNTQPTISQYVNDTSFTIHVDHQSLSNLVNLFIGYFRMEMGKGKKPIEIVGHLVWIKLGHYRCGFFLHFLN